MESIEVLGKYRFHIGQGLLKNLEIIIDLNDLKTINDKFGPEYHRDNL